MKRKLVNYLAFGLLLTGCASQPIQDNVIKISGKVQFPDNKYNMEIVQRQGFNKIVLDSCKVNADGTYSFEMEVKEPGVYSLDCQKWQGVTFWAEDEDLVIDFRGQDTAKIKIKNPPYVYIQGGPKNELINLNNWDNYRNYQLMIGISQGVYFIPGLDDQTKQNVSMDFYKMLDKEASARTEYLVKTYGDLNSVLALLPSVKNEEIISQAIGRLEAKNPTYAPLVAYKKNIAEAKVQRERLALGKPAPQFSFPNEDGKKSYGPQDFKGEYVILDFWASWCGPCRQEVPNLKKLYETYDGKGVAFLSVSIDKKNEDWMKALGEEKMPWPQVLAPNAGKDIMKEYQFSGIPYILILDKKGNIVAKGVRGEILTEKLAELVLGKEPAQKEQKEAVVMPAMGM